MTVREDDPYDTTSGVPKLDEKFVVLYYDSDGRRVITKEWPPKPPDLNGYNFASLDEPLCLSVGDLQSICNNKNGTERVLVKNVKKLEITDEDGDTTMLTPPLKLAITCSAPSRGGERAQNGEQEEEFSTTVSVFPRNVRW